MGQIQKLIIPVFSALGLVLLVMTIIDFDDDNNCIRCWPTNVNLYLTYILFGLALLVSLFATVTGALAKPDSIKRSLIGVGALGLITVISYVMASGEFMKDYPEGTSETAIKLSGMGLYMLYILTFLAVLSIIYSAVARVMNK